MPNGTSTVVGLQSGPTEATEARASTTDPDARLYKKSRGQPSRLCSMGHLLIG
jgi:hypothetical protein